MNYRLVFTSAARKDIERLYRFLADRDVPAAQAALDAIDYALDLLREFPFTARKADGTNPLLRELLIPFGGAGYVFLYEIENATTVTVLAVRHQREDDYH